MGVAGADAACRPSGPAAFAALAWALLVAGLASSAVGNLRRPNHLCSLLLWAVVAAVGLLLLLLLLWTLVDRRRDHQSRRGA